MPTIPESLLSCDAAEREALMRSLPAAQAVALNRAFGEWAQAGQVVPDGKRRSWVLMAGRGRT